MYIKCHHHRTPSSWHVTSHDAQQHPTTPPITAMEAQAKTCMPAPPNTPPDRRTPSPPKQSWPRKSKPASTPSPRQVRAVAAPSSRPAPRTKIPNRHCVSSYGRSSVMSSSTIPRWRTPTMRLDNFVKFVFMGVLMIFARGL